jgi:hypothetical protein
MTYSTTQVIIPQASGADLSVEPHHRRHVRTTVQPVLWRPKTMPNGWPTGVSKTWKPVWLVRPQPGHVPHVAAVCEVFS